MEVPNIEMYQDILTEVRERKEKRAAEKLGQAAVGPAKRAPSLQILDTHVAEAWSATCTEATQRVESAADFLASLDFLDAEPVAS